MQVIKRLKNQSLGKKGSKGQNYIFKKTLVVSQKAMVDSLIKPDEPFSTFYHFSAVKKGVKFQTSKSHFYYVSRIISFHQQGF